MAKGVGHSWALLKGRLTGNAEEAKGFLSSLTSEERSVRNKQEQQSIVKPRKRRRPLGTKPTVRHYG